MPSLCYYIAKLLSHIKCKFWFMGDAPYSKYRVIVSVKWFITLVHIQHQLGIIIWTWSEVIFNINILRKWMTSWFCVIKNLVVYINYQMLNIFGNTSHCIFPSNSKPQYRSAAFSIEILLILLSELIWTFSCGVVMLNFQLQFRLALSQRYKYTCNSTW